MVQNNPDQGVMYGYTEEVKTGYNLVIVEAR